MIDVSENSVLRNDVISLPQLDDLGLLQSLHCLKLAGLLVLAEHNSTE